MPGESPSPLTSWDYVCSGQTGLPMGTVRVPRPRASLPSTFSSPFWGQLWRQLHLSVPARLRPQDTLTSLTGLQTHISSSVSTSLRPPTATFTSLSDPWVFPLPRQLSPHVTHGQAPMQLSDLTLPTGGELLVGPGMLGDHKAQPAACHALPLSLTPTGPLKCPFPGRCPAPALTALCRVPAVCLALGPAHALFIPFPINPIRQG